MSNAGISTLELTRALASIDRYSDTSHQEVIELYKPILEATPFAECRVLRDQAYGPHIRHKIDLYMPDFTPRDPLPVLLYFHQGGFTGGDKNQGGALFFGNVGRFFAQNGVIAGLVNFRLPPDGVWPSGGEDAGAALAWVRDNIAPLGGDPKRIFLAGHSSGATHVADFALKTSTPPERRAECAGLILLSGRFQLPPPEPNLTSIHNFGRPRVAAYYGEDPSLWPERGVIGNIASETCPVYVSVGEYEHYAFEMNALAIMAELAEKTKRMPRFRQVRGHTHLSQILQIGAKHDTLGPDLLDFVINPYHDIKWQGLVGDFR